MNARNQAIAERLPRYKRKCPDCGYPWAYTSSGSCVRCSTRKSTKRVAAMRAALKNGGK